VERLAAPQHPDANYDLIVDSARPIAGGSNQDNYPLVIVTIPIYINGNDNFTSANGVTSGSGTVDDPYIIENWTIDASVTHGIWIEDTSAYFVIRNCLVENGGGNYHGIYLNNVINGRIDNNTCLNNNYGIYIYSDSDGDVTLENNTCEGNSNSGIYLSYSSLSNATIRNNTCSNNSNGYGIYIYSDYSLDNAIIENNICESNSNYGIYIECYPLYSATLRNNSCLNNSNYGIYLYSDGTYVEDQTSENAIVENNTCSNNSNYGIYLEYYGYPASLSNATIRNNTCSNNSNGYGIYIYSDYSLDNAIIENNICESNSNYGIYIECYPLYSATLNNNICRNSPGYGIYIYSGDSAENAILESNTCENNDDGGIYMYYPYGLHNAIVRNNKSSSNTSGSGIYLRSGGDLDNAHLENNTCDNNSEGIYLQYLENTTLSKNTCRGNSNYGIRLYDSSRNFIENNCIDNNGHGIYIDGSVTFAIIRFNRITNNTAVDSGIHIAAGVDSTGIKVNNNDIIGNSAEAGNYGVYNGGDGVLNARYNWWGHSSGPGGVGPGSGDNISENVAYAPWLMSSFENVVSNQTSQGIAPGANTVSLSGVADVTLDATQAGEISITVITTLAGTPIPEGLLRAGMFWTSALPKT